MPGWGHAHWAEGTQQNMNLGHGGISCLAREGRSRVQSPVDESTAVWPQPDHI